MGNKKEADDIVKYATWRLSLLQLMAVIAVLGIVLTVVLKQFFG